MEELREKHETCVDAARQAFDELCAMVEALQAKREERREASIARFQKNRAMNARMREKNQKLRAQYRALLIQYNELAEEVKDGSDSSSSEDDDDDDNCCLM